METDKLNGWLVLAANVGVIVGLLLLVYEIRQNTELMRGEIHSIRAEGKASRQMDLANNGVVTEVLAKAVAAGFPDDPVALAALDPAERIRLRLMYVAIIEVTANWHIQCEHGLLVPETCGHGQRQQIVSIVPLARGAGVDLSFTPPSFVAEVQGIMREEGLQPPNDDGTWPD